MRTIIRILIGLVLILVAAGLLAFAYLRSSLPKTSGTVKAAGLDGQLEIVRDKDGVPHIFAATDHDAFFALGYVHAQDRMWQMEFQRRIGAGRLSEILGDATLDTDKFLRTLGTYRAAKSAWAGLSEESQNALQAYADGVNAWIDEGHVLPPEFLILGVKPEPWTVYDSIVWTKMMAWDLGGNYPIYHVKEGDIIFCPRGLKHHILTQGTETSFRLAITDNENLHVFTADDEDAPPPRA